MNIAEVVKKQCKAEYFICQDRYGKVTVSRNDVIRLIQSKKLKLAHIADYGKGPRIIVDNSAKYNTGRKADFIRLYHISFEDLGKYCRFKPRIPRNTAGAEDKKTSRLCLSDSIENCINAIPDGPDMIGNEPIYVYYFDLWLKDPYLITWKTLYNSGLVPDAGITHEYWYKSDIVMPRRKIVINSFDDKYTYVVNESDKDRLFRIILRESKLPEQYIEKYSKESMVDIANQLLQKDRRIKPYLSKILAEADFETMLTIRNIQYTIIE